MKTQPKAINAIVAFLSGFPSVGKVVLFGSRARGDEEERSDIDLAVSGQNITWRQWLDMVENTLTRRLQPFSR